MWRVFFTSAVVAVVLRGCMRWCASGECSSFASGGFIIWDVHGGTGDYFSYELLPMSMLGLMGGLFRCLFNQLTLYISAWRRSKLHRLGNRGEGPGGLPRRSHHVCALVPRAVLRVVPAVPDPIRYPDVVCPRPLYHWGNFVQFNCKGTAEYNDLATILFNTQVRAHRPRKPFRELAFHFHQFAFHQFSRGHLRGHLSKTFKKTEVHSRCESLIDSQVGWLE